MTDADLDIAWVGPIATIRLRRPPHNYFDEGLIGRIADAVDEADATPEIHVILLAAEGRNFCAGADFSRSHEQSGEALYAQAARMFGRAKPMIAAIQGAAVGGGLGLALTADLRIASSDARFQANFAALGLHPGFAITQSLAAVVGLQVAREILLSARRVGAEEALSIGLIDRLVPAESLFDDALAFAGEIARNAPLALISIRAALNRPDRQAAEMAMAEELCHQNRLVETEDFREALRARAERRAPVFVAR